MKSHACMTLAILLLPAAACGTAGAEIDPFDPGDAGQVAPDDAGPAADAGADAGSEDAGDAEDAGLVEPDAGLAQDAGSDEDAGLVEDAGLEPLRDEADEGRNRFLRWGGVHRNPPAVGRRLPLDHRQRNLVPVSLDESRLARTPPPR